METVEMLDKCKEKLGLSSDYALAKELDVLQARVSSYRKGREHPDVYVCFRIAEILGESPSSIIAQIEAKNAKNDNKRLYFKRFFSMGVLWITLVGTSAIYSGFSGDVYAAGNTVETRANSTYQDITRNAKGLFGWVRRKLALLKNERYFTCNWHVKYL